MARKAAKATPKQKAARKAFTVKVLKKEERALEKKGGSKSPKEAKLEKRISKLTGKKYVGKR